MTFGLYKHYKGGWYLGLWKVRESTNDQPQEEKVLYFSLKKLKFYVRRASEFFSTVYPLKAAVPVDVHNGCYRFLKKFPPHPCYCAELGAYESCPTHGVPQYGSHKVLNRFDGKEHEEWIMGQWKK